MPAPTPGYVTTAQHPDQEIGVRTVHSCDCMCVHVNFCFCKERGHDRDGTGLSVALGGSDVQAM